MAWPVVCIPPGSPNQEGFLILRPRPSLLLFPHPVLHTSASSSCCYLPSSLMKRWEVRSSLTSPKQWILRLRMLPEGAFFDPDNSSSSGANIWVRFKKLLMHVAGLYAPCGVQMQCLVWWLVHNRLSIKKYNSAMNGWVKVPIPQASVLILSKLLGWSCAVLTGAWVWHPVHLLCHCRYLALPLICWAS